MNSSKSTFIFSQFSSRMLSICARRSLSFTTFAMSSKHIIDDCVPLQMPSIGLGTYLLDASQAKPAIRTAILEAGYRRIDCAPVYFNEDAIGDALHDILSSQNEVKREDLYIVSKLASPFHRNVEAAIRKTLLDLRLDYLDMYLIHWPVAFHPVPIPEGTRGWENEDIGDSAEGKNIDPSVSVHETWHGMQEVVRKGLVREIGVSNFPVILLHELLSKQPKIPPVVNQCEMHPYLSQDQLRAYCKARGVKFQAYSPLGSGGYIESDEPNLLEDPILLELAKKHNATSAQIALAWVLQYDTSVVVKSSSLSHQRENMAAASLTLDESDKRKIEGLNRNHRYFRPEDWWPELAMAVFH